MRSFPFACLLALFLSATSAAAQQPWQGEWGAYSGPTAAEGRRLAIKDCTQQGGTAACKFDLEAQRPGGNAGTAEFQTLTLQSATTAVAVLQGGDDGPCRLGFTLQPGPKPSIVVTATGKSCTSYYSTLSTAISMAGTYPFRSATLYSGSKPEACFLDTSPARSAICTHPELAKLEDKWSDLAEEYPLQPPADKDEGGYKHAEQMDAAILHACDADANPTACLTKRYTTETAAMQAKQDTYLQGTTDRGDPVEGGKLAQRIAGRYRHREENGDVQGHSYMTTDTLLIRPVGASSIHFDTKLNFFNGHECSLSGGALYRKDGSFVFDDAPKNAVEGFPVCRLAIVPTAKGIGFVDVTGGCKMSYCGERGSWGPDAFSFRERVAESTAAPKATGTR